MKALWNETVIASSSDVEEIDGNFYFPLDSLNKKYFVESTTKSHCPLKGKAHYLHIIIDDVLNEDAAWYYPENSTAYVCLKNRVAFWKGVEIRATSSVVNLDLLNILNSFF